MRRIVSSLVAATVLEPARVELQVAVAGPAPDDEQLEVLLGGAAVRPRELASAAGGRVHVVDVAAGALEVRYAARVDRTPPAAPAPALDVVEYLRPSRYAEADKLAGFARAEFGRLDAGALATAVVAWVATRLTYTPGSSRGTDGALDTLVASAGVCRDYAHLTIGLLRACGVPARLVSVYAPGLHPMDFHAVVEVLLEQRWCVVDATLLAPRSSLVRIATGRDAADTAFLSTYGGEVRLDAMSVQAVVDGLLPADDLGAVVYLA